MRRWIKRILIVLAVFLLPPVGFYFYVTWQGERELRAVMAELDANESPWRWEDIIAARPKLDEKTDARAVVLNARQLAPGFFGRFSIWEKVYDRPPNALIPPEDFEPFDALIKEVQPGLTEARKLAAMPGARFQLAWPENLLSTSFDDVQKAREFIALLRSAAAWHAQIGDIDAAMEDCLAMQRVCQSLEDEPTMIVHLVRIALQAISTHALERVLAQGQPSPKQANRVPADGQGSITTLEKLQRAWEQFDRERAIVMCVRGERAYTHRWFEALTDGKASIQQATANPKGISISSWERLQGIYLRATSKQSHAWILRNWSEFIRSIELPEPERAARQLELGKQAAQAPGLAKMLMPAVHKTLDAHRRSEAQVRCAIAGLAAERFRRERDCWPKSLTELCPEFLAQVPDDPYSGKPLQLRVAADGIVIYSVGPDGKQAGDYQEKTAAKQSVVSYEFRLWNVDQRRKIIVGEP
jgi:hypothetical protein